MYRHKKFFSDDNIFNVVNIFLICFLVFLVLYPLFYVFFASISSGRAVELGMVTFFPREFTLTAYANVFDDAMFWRSYVNSILITAVGSTFSMIVSVAGAYALSRKGLPFIRFFNFMLLFTMWFGAGMIPTFINLRNLRLLNMGGIIIAFGISTFLIIVQKSAFLSVPSELPEAATIDGANEFQTFTRVCLPSIKPTIATTWLMSAMGRWNGFFWAMIILRDERLIPLQVYLRRLIIERDIQAEMIEDMAVAVHSQVTVIYAVIVLSVIPILIVFPFMQKYFKKGIMEGGIKG